MKISKILIGGVVALSMVLPLAASAATFTNIKFGNGDVTTSVTGGATVSGTARLVVGVGEVVENIQTDLIGDSLAPVCVSVNGDLGYQEGTYENVPFSIQAAPNTQTNNLELRGAGIFGGVRSISCSDGVVSTNSFPNAVRVIAGGSTSVGNTSIQSQIDQLSASVAALVALMAHPVVPTPTGACATLATKMSGAVRGSGQYYFGSPNGKLQTYLLDQGFDIPWLTDGSGTRYGFYGDQTNTALTSFKSANGCN
jgi:hypothetical protein